MYLTKFDKNGKTNSFLRPGINIDTTDVSSKLTEGYIEISDEDYMYYIGNRGNGKNNTGYIRGDDGKPIDAPAHVPSKEEQANALASTYTAAVKTANDGIILAAAEGDTDAVADYKADKSAALSEYKTKLEAVNNG